MMSDYEAKQLEKYSNNVNARFKELEDRIARLEEQWIKYVPNYEPSKPTGHHWTCGLLLGTKNACDCKPLSSKAECKHKFDMYGHCDNCGQFDVEPEKAECEHTNYIRLAEHNGKIMAYCTECNAWKEVYPYEPDYIVIDRKVAEEWLPRMEFTTAEMYLPFMAKMIQEIRKALGENK